MKKSHLVILMLLVITTFLLMFGKGKPVWAEDTEESPTLFGEILKDHDIEITGTATLDYYDKYVWRGQYLDRDNVLQPGLSFSAKGLTVGYWGNWDVESNDALNSGESDYYVSYAYTFEPLTFSVGHTWYDFPQVGTSSKEVFASVAWATLLTPTIAIYHDYEDGKELNTDGDGNYYTFSLSHSVPLCSKYGISLELAATYGYIDGQWLNGEGSHLTPTIGFKIPISKGMTLTPTVGYNATFGDLEDPAVANVKSKVFGGVKMAYAF